MMTSGVSHIRKNSDLFSLYVEAVRNMRSCLALQLGRLAPRQQYVLPGEWRRGQGDKRDNQEKE